MMAKDKMKISLTKVALQVVLQRCQGAAGKNLIQPILNCALLEVQGAQLGVTTFDLEVGITSRCDIDEVICFGAVAVPIARLVAIVKSLPGNQVELQEVYNQQLRITAEDAEFFLKCEPASEFPPLDVPADLKPVIRTDCDIYQKLIDACRHAVSTDMTKYNLAGINFELKGQRLTACATDGHRLSLAGRELEAEATTGPDFSHVIAKKGLEEIKRLSPGPVEIYVYKNQIAFWQPAAVLVIRLLDADFPDYRRVIPTKHPGFISAARMDFGDCVARVAIVSNGRGVIIEGSGNQLTVSGGTDQGQGKDIVDAEIDGSPLRICVDSKYLMDGLHGLGEEIVIKYHDGKAPLVLLPLEQAVFDERLEVLMSKQLPSAD
jgi:DNA polymerase III subunit beta